MGAFFRPYIRGMQGPYRILNKLLPALTWQGPAQAAPTLYLTFDDGPIPEVTEWVLDRLHDYQAKASFFCIGTNVDKHPEIFRRIQREGHAVGNHSQHHLKGWSTSKQAYLQDIAKADALIRSPLFRPPYGKVKPSQWRALRKAGYEIIMWNALSRDFRLDLSGEDCWRQVQKQARDRSIVVFHDSKKAAPRMKAALEKTLDYYSAQGFVFRALPH